MSTQKNGIANSTWLCTQSVYRYFLPLALQPCGDSPNLVVILRVAQWLKIINFCLNQLEFPLLAPKYSGRCFASLMAGGTGDAPMTQRAMF